MPEFAGAGSIAKGGIELGFDSATASALANPIRFALLVVLIFVAHAGNLARTSKIGAELEGGAETVGWPHQKNAIGKPA